jgi:cytochrome c oxidase accessory protein FixG
MAQNANIHSNEFRDHVSTVDADGKRIWVYAEQPKGKFYTWRTYLSIAYLVVFFALPFIHVHDEPLFMFNVVERKFILFGQIFWPQDFFIFGLGMLVFIVFIILFTVVFGRVFCGWACPQTIFMEMVFRRIEYWIEGHTSRQKSLDREGFTAHKIGIKFLKHSIFFLISFIIANTFLAYIIGVNEVIEMIMYPTAHVGGFISLLLFTGVFYGVYARFREQVCTTVCPYGRLQGVLLDKNSIVVAYDHQRGEPRHKWHKHETRSKGDCIDCFQCVKVCPTGIDIRNGTQLECVNCTACIDACDHIMESVHLQKGLIRYASENQITLKEKFRFTTRMKAYTALLAVLISVEVFLLATRSDMDVAVNRARGLLYQEQPDNHISNLYTVKIINKTRKNFPVVIKLLNAKGEVQVVGKPLYLKGNSFTEGMFFVKLPASFIKQRKTKLTLGVYSGKKLIKRVRTNFFGPAS